LLFSQPPSCSRPSPPLTQVVQQRVLPQAVLSALWLAVRLGLLWVLVWVARPEMPLQVLTKRM
jgi:hypothetical protein